MRQENNLLLRSSERKGAEEEACDRQVRGHLLSAQLAEAFQLCFW